MADDLFGDVEITVQCLPPKIDSWGPAVLAVADWPRSGGGDDEEEDFEYEDDEFEDEDYDDEDDDIFDDEDEDDEEDEVDEDENLE